jgi:nucleotide-binding universal stress UspA family protein
MKKVLIALDYDPSAEKIAAIGYDLAKAMNADVVLLHVTAEAAYYAAMDYSPVMGYAGFNGFTSMNLSEMTNRLKTESVQFLEQSKKHLGDDSIITVVADGETADTILFTANEQQADIIVLGSHSRSGLDKLLMGSVAEKVLHHTKVPLFIVPTKEEK